MTLAHLVEVCDTDGPEWQALWTFFNAFASGKTQEQWSRVEPLAALGHIYQGLAVIYTKQKEAIAEAKEYLGSCQSEPIW